VFTFKGGKRYNKRKRKDVTMKTTPLYQNHLNMGAKMVDFAGYLMPLSYTSIEDEHHAVRHQAGYFDVSHMGEILIEGPGATAFIEKVFTNQRPGLNQARYGLLLKKDGMPVDDVLVYRHKEDAYWIVCNASNIQNVMEHLEAIPFEGTLLNLSEEIAMIAVQGPEAKDIVEAIVNVNLDLKRFHFKKTEYLGAPLFISRTGYTGEDGFEIYGEDSLITEIWTALGTFENAWPCGLGARDTLRFEAGYPLFGHEILRFLTPQSSGLSMFIDYTKTDTLGIKALLEEQEKGLQEIIVGVELCDKGILREGYGLYDGDTRIGEVTTGYKLRHFEYAKALAFMKMPYTALGTEIEAEIREKRIKAKVIPYPFYQKLKKKKVDA
jgi:aminomethyltransferase